MIATWLRLGIADSVGQISSSTKVIWFFLATPCEYVCKAGHYERSSERAWTTGRGWVNFADDGRDDAYPIGPPLSLSPSSVFSRSIIISHARLCQKITRATDSFFPVSLTFSPSLLHAAFASAHPFSRLPLSAFFPANDDIFPRPFAPAWHGMVVAKKRALEKRRNTQFCPCHGVRNGICRRPLPCTLV